MIGSFSPAFLAGVQMLSVRQSSLIPVKLGVSVAPFGGKRCGAGGCTQTSPNLVASRTPCHDLGSCGCFQRRSPTGAAANGMPLNTVTPGSLPGSPWTRPCCVRTGCVSVVDVELTPPPDWAQAAIGKASTVQARAARSGRVLIIGQVSCEIGRRSSPGEPSVTQAPQAAVQG